MIYFEHQDHKFIRTKYFDVFVCEKCGSTATHVYNTFYFCRNDGCDGADYDDINKFPKCEEILNNIIIKSIIE